MAKYLSKSKIEKLAKEIRSFLLEHEMWVDVTIYFNGKAFSTDDRQGNYYYNDPSHLVVLEDQDPHKISEYASDILTMTFEGDFYDVVNYGEWPQALDQFEKIISSYGLYYELGYAWQLGLYPA